MRVSALRLADAGSVGYLEAEQRQAMTAWLKTKNYENVAEKQRHIENEYGAVFDGEAKLLYAV
ncbi:hypothetical protein [Microcoleus sp. BROC3]|uniref:hypothetical protein n=1 Tax=Microcoleus sp. BROC3 TaxID=3055323 RepID=UPI002FD27D40